MMNYKYLLVRENRDQNLVFQTLEEARFAQRLIPASECTGIVRVNTLLQRIMAKESIGFSLRSSDDTGFVLLTLE